MTIFEKNNSISAITIALEEVNTEKPLLVEELRVLVYGVGLNGLHAFRVLDKELAKLKDKPRKPVNLGVIECFNN